MSFNRETDSGQSSDVKVCTACNKTNDKYGNLLRCNSCPHVLHSTCAGYAKTDALPHPWKCWHCAGGAQHWQHPTEPVHIPSKRDREGKNWNIFIASDDLCEVFYKAIVLKHTKDTVTVKYPEWPEYPPEQFSLTDRRLWRGNLLKAAWHFNDEDKSLQPKSRVLAFIDDEEDQDQDHDTTNIKDSVEEDNEAAEVIIECEEEREKQHAPAPALAAAFSAEKDDDIARSPPLPASDGNDSDQSDRKKEGKKKKEKRKREELNSLGPSLLPKSTDGKKKKEKKESRKEDEIEIDASPCSPPSPATGHEDESPVDEAMEEGDGNLIEEIELEGDDDGEFNADVDPGDFDNENNGGVSEDGGGGGGGVNSCSRGKSDADDADDGVANGVEEEELERKETQQQQHEEQEPEPESEVSPSIPSAAGTATPPPTISLQQLDDKEYESGPGSGSRSGRDSAENASCLAAAAATATATAIAATDAAPPEEENAGIQNAVISSLAGESIETINLTTVEDSPAVHIIRVGDQDILVSKPPPPPPPSGQRSQQMVSTITMAQQLATTTNTGIPNGGVSYPRGLDSTGNDPQLPVLPKRKESYTPPSSSTAPEKVYLDQRASSRQFATAQQQQDGLYQQQRMQQLQLQQQQYMQLQQQQQQQYMLQQQQQTFKPLLIRSRPADPPSKPPSIITTTTRPRATPTTTITTKRTSIPPPQQNQQKQQRAYGTLPPPPLLRILPTDPVYVKYKMCEIIIQLGESTFETSGLFFYDLRTECWYCAAYRDEGDAYPGIQINEKGKGRKKTVYRAVIRYPGFKSVFQCLGLPEPGYWSNREEFKAWYSVQIRSAEQVSAFTKLKWKSLDDIPPIAVGPASEVPRGKGSVVAAGGGRVIVLPPNYSIPQQQHVQQQQQPQQVQSQQSPEALQAALLQLLGAAAAAPQKASSGPSSPRSPTRPTLPLIRSYPAVSPRAPTVQTRAELSPRTRSDTIDAINIQNLEFDAANILANLAATFPPATAPSPPPLDTTTTTSFHGGRSPLRSKKQKHIAPPTLDFAYPAAIDNGAAAASTGFHDFGLRPTAESLSLGIGSEVEVRWFDDECGIRGSWYAAKIIDIMAGPAPAPHFRFYRIECVELVVSEDNPDDHVKEWMPLALPAPWDKEELVVQIRTLQKTRAYHPNVHDTQDTPAGDNNNSSIRGTASIYGGTKGGTSGTGALNVGSNTAGDGTGAGPSSASKNQSLANYPKLKKGQRIEAQWDDGWWMGFVRNIKSNGKLIEVDFDEAPLGEGGEPKTLARSKIRPQHPKEHQWFGMLEPGVYEYPPSMSSSGKSRAVANQNQESYKWRQQQQQQQQQMVSTPLSPARAAAAIAAGKTNTTSPSMHPLPEQVHNYIASMSPDALVREHQGVELYRQDLLRRVQVCHDNNTGIVRHEESIRARKKVLEEEERKIAYMAQHIEHRRTDLTTLQGQLNSVETAMRAEHAKRTSDLAADAQRTAGMLGEHVRKLEQRARNLQQEFARKEEEMKKEHEKKMLEAQGGSLQKILDEKAADLLSREQQLKAKAEELENMRRKLQGQVNHPRAEHEENGKVAPSATEAAVAAAAQANAIQHTFFTRPLPSLPNPQLRMLPPLAPPPAPAAVPSLGLPGVPIIYSMPSSPLQPPGGGFIMQHQQQQEQQQPMQFVPITNDGGVGDTGVNDNKDIKNNPGNTSK